MRAIIERETFIRTKNGQSHRRDCRKKVTGARARTANKIRNNFSNLFRYNSGFNTAKSMILAERRHYTSNLLGVNCVHVSKNAIVVDWSRKNYFRHCHTLHNVHRYDETSDAEDLTDKDNGSSGKDTNWARIATQRRLMPTSITANPVRTGPAFVGIFKCTALHGMVSYLHAKNYYRSNLVYV